MGYRVVLPKRVKKELNKIDLRFRSRVLLALLGLSENPYLGKKLEGKYSGERSYVVWPYRIIYRIKNKELVVLVLKIGHRQGVYGRR